MDMSTLGGIARIVLIPKVEADPLQEWIEPTLGINTDLISGTPTQGTRTRTTTEWILRQRLEGQVVSQGSIVVARVKAKDRHFTVDRIEYSCPSGQEPQDSGMVDDTTILEIGLPSMEVPASKQTYGGMASLEDEICSLIAESFRHADAYRRLGIPNTKAVIVTGVAGSGKKTIIRSSCQRAGLRTFPLSLARTLAEKDIMESEQANALSYITRVFDMALLSAPSAVVIQDLDTIAKDRRVDSQLQSTIISILGMEMKQAREASKVFVLAVSRNRAKLPEVFTRKDFFQHEFQIPIPVRSQRQDILKSYIGDLEFRSDSLLTESSRIAQSTKAAQMSSGYVAKDLRHLCRSALLHALRAENENAIVQSNADDINTLTTMLTAANIKQQDESASLENHTSRIQSSAILDWPDFSYALKNSKPSQQIEFESAVHTRGWKDFGGYDDVKNRVHQAIHWPQTHPKTFERLRVKPQKGFLLYGPSGCGKTMLVQAMAADSNMNFIPIKGPEIFSKYLGETEATLRRLFAMARQIAPCILFFDEMDSIGAKRGWGGDGDSQSSNGVNERVLSTLLNEMDGVEERAGVFVIGCTNQPRAMDDALLRPGRLDQVIYLGYPGLKDRRDIIDTIGHRIPIPTDDALRQRLAEITVGFSPADLDALFREAAILSLRIDISTDKVRMEDIELIVQRIKPSVQTRIRQSSLEQETSSDESDVLIPEIYRDFQQGR